MTALINVELMNKGCVVLIGNKMINLSLDQLTSVEKRLQYLVEANNDKYLERVSQVFFN